MANGSTSLFRLLVKRFLQITLIIFIISNVINKTSRHVTASIAKEQAAYWKAVVRDNKDYKELKLGAIALETGQLLATHIGKYFGVVRQQVFEEWVPIIRALVEPILSDSEPLQVVEVEPYNGMANNFTGEQPQMCPIHGLYRISSKYGKRIHPTKHIPKMHWGIDLSCMAGTAIYAPAKGVVTETKYNKGYGKTIKVQHASGYSTLFAHCSRIMVEKGDSVYPYTVIGKVGKTGTASGNHLHYEIFKSGKNMDPLALMQQ